jgi:hypothetical protein
MNTPALSPAATDAPSIEKVDLRAEFNEVGIGEVLDQLDRELIGLKPVKTRIREIASLLLIERIRCGSPAFCTSSVSCAVVRSCR